MISEKDDADCDPGDSEYLSETIVFLQSIVLGFLLSLLFKPARRSRKYRFHNAPHQQVMGISDDKFSRPSLEET
jgi:hypothetical protein